MKGRVKEEELKKLRAGVKIEDYTTSPAKIKEIKYDEKTDKTEIEITIHEGKNRQIRKMFEAIGYEVLRLHRSKIGMISVQDMKLGEWRYLKQDEIKNLLDNKKNI